MKRSQMQKLIKNNIRVNSVLLQQWKEEEISFGRMAEELSKSILSFIEQIGMLPPVNPEAIEDNYYAGLACYHEWEREDPLSVGIDGPLPNPRNTTVIEKRAYDEAQTELGKQDVEIIILKSHIRFLLSFFPKGPVPKGLAPMSYHTLSYEKEIELQNRIDAIRDEIER